MTSVPITIVSIPPVASEYRDPRPGAQEPQGELEPQLPEQEIPEFPPSYFTVVEQDRQNGVSVQKA